VRSTAIMFGDSDRHIIAFCFQVMTLAVPGYRRGMIHRVIGTARVFARGRYSCVFSVVDTCGEIATAAFSAFLQKTTISDWPYSSDGRLKTCLHSSDA